MLSQVRPVLYLSSGFVYIGTEGGGYTVVQKNGLYIKSTFLLVNRMSTEKTAFFFELVISQKTNLYRTLKCLK